MINMIINVRRLTLKDRVGRTHSGGDVTRRRWLGGGRG